VSISRIISKGLSCGHAIFSLRKVVEHYVAGGSTVNVCLLDLSKAFHKTNHFALYLKLMDRPVPIQILSVLENWLSWCMSCVKLGSAYSYFDELNFDELKSGVRQRGVLSPFLFAIFIDDLVKLIDTANIGCKTGGSCTSIFLYADDIILLAPSAQALQSLVDICELELKRLDMAINASKSACMRFRPRYKSTCANVIVSGLKINWVSSHRYLCVYLESSFNLKISYTANKAGFYKSFNAIYGKVGRTASEEVLFALLKSKCLQILL